MRRTRTEASQDHAEDLLVALEAFPVTGQHNLNSTATRGERSKWIGEVLDWANRVRLPILAKVAER